MVKKLSALLLMIIILTSSISLNSASASVGINKAKAVMEVDSTLSLNIGNTKAAVKWSSSKKSVATVNSSGIVTAKEEGVATITASTNSQKLTCKITVIDSNKPVIVVDVGDKITLSKGIYIVGEDIDAGKYNLNATYDWCRVKVFENTDTDRPFVSEQLITDDSPTYNNLVLKNGNKIEITYNGQIEFIRTK